MNYNQTAVKLRLSFLLSVIFTKDFTNIRSYVLCYSCHFAQISVFELVCYALLLLIFLHFCEKHLQFFVKCDKI